MGNHIRDEDNPEFFTSNHLLSKILRNEINCFEFASAEMAARGFDANGNWIGFEKASAEHQKRINRTNPESKENTITIIAFIALPVPILFKQLSISSFRKFYKLVDNHFAVLDLAVRDHLKSVLKSSPVKVVNVAFSEVEEEDNNGLIIFDITLEGKGNELKKVAYLDSVLIYDWGEGF